MTGRKRHTLDDLLAEVCAYVADNVPGRVASHIRIDLDDGRKISHPVTAKPPDCHANGQSNGQTNCEEYTLQDAILDALLESAEHLTSSALARKVGRRPSGSFRGVLAKMKLDGDLTVDSDGKYMIPE